VFGAATRFTNRGLNVQTTDIVLHEGKIILDGSHAQGSNLTTDNLYVELGGEFRVESGASSTTNFTRLATDGASTATLTVTGAGSQHTATDTLFVGINGTGILNVEAGGVVNSGGAYIGTYQGSGTATVTGSGSQFNTGGIYIAGKSTSGTAATGSLTIADNATVKATAFTRLWDSGAGHKCSIMAP
jgi:T5SS/PEP-CTERM-associated repeat protein